MRYKKLKTLSYFYGIAGYLFVSLLAHADSDPFSLGPYVKFLTPDSAELSWQTEQPATASVVVTAENKRVDTLTLDSSSTHQNVILNHLQPKTKYIYQVQLQHDNTTIKSATYEIDNTFNYTKFPLPDSPYPFEEASQRSWYEKTAQRILRQTKVTQGYCVVYGCRDGRLAYELAKQSALTVIGVDEDARRIQRIRQNLLRANLYGTRFTFYTVDSLKHLPLPDAFANLVVSERILQEGKPVGDINEIARLVRPSGGTVYLGAWKKGIQSALDEWLNQFTPSLPVQWDLSAKGSWVSYVRPSLPGAGAWTHQYGNPGNTSNSGDTLFGASRTDQMEVQWIGRPGADFGIDRNPRMPAPLAVNGRLFHQGMNRMAALDAYNGTILWSLEIPDLRRVNMPRDASNWCADDNFLYTAIRDRCWKLDASNGNLVQAFTLPDSVSKNQYDWGYIANQKDLLFGSAVKRGSAYEEFFGNDTWYDKTSGFGTGKICSDVLFALEKDSGQVVWEYRRGSVINTTIAFGGDTFYFVESRYPGLMTLSTGRIESPDLWKDQYLVALDLATGKKKWEKSIDTQDGIVVFFLLYTDASLLISSSAQGTYHLYAFSPLNGEPLWEASHPWTGNNHSGHMQHPVVVKDTVYLEPYGYNIQTGKRLPHQIGRHSGCATYAATAKALIYRGDSRRISMWDIDSNLTTSWFNLRPSCWLSVIPAGGMVLSPEGGGGCSCGNWLETSLGFYPQVQNTN